MSPLDKLTVISYNLKLNEFLQKITKKKKVIFGTGVKKGSLVPKKTLVRSKKKTMIRKNQVPFQKLIKNFPKTKSIVVLSPKLYKSSAGIKNFVSSFNKPKEN